MELRITLFNGGNFIDETINVEKSLGEIFEKSDFVKCLEEETLWLLEEEEMDEYFKEKAKLNLSENGNLNLAELDKVCQFLNPYFILTGDLINFVVIS